MGYLDGIITEPTTTKEEYINNVLNNEFELDADEFKKSISEHQRFDESIYDRLPELISLGCQCFDGAQRDIYLFSSLISLSSCFDRVYVKYFGKPMYANLYGFLLAKAASGKGSTTWAEYIIKGIDNLKRIKYQEELEKLNLDAEDSKKKLKKEDIPTPLMHIIPLNISSAGVTQLLEANKNAFAYTTEIDELTSSMGNSWGDALSNILRKLYHHENANSYRSTNKEFQEVRGAKLSLLLAGTQGQFHKIMPSAENGLLSRFAVYSINEQIYFKDPFEEQYDEMESIFDSIKEDVTRKYLSYSKYDKQFRFRDDQKQLFKQLGDKELAYYTEMLGDDSAQIVLRHFFMLTRIAMILTCCRHEACEFEKTIYCDDEDFMLAVDIMSTLKKHAFSMFNQVNGGNEDSAKPKISNKGKNMIIFERLDGEFATQDAIKIGKSLNVSEKWVRNWLSQLAAKGILQNLNEEGKRGFYRKRAV